MVFRQIRQFRCISRHKCDFSITWTQRSTNTNQSRARERLRRHHPYRKRGVIWPPADMTRLPAPVAEWRAWDAISKIFTTWPLSLDFLYNLVMVFTEFTKSTDCKIFLFQYNTCFFVHTFLKITTHIYIKTFLPKQTLAYSACIIAIDV